MLPSILNELSVEGLTVGGQSKKCEGETLVVRSPIDRRELKQLAMAAPSDVALAVAAAQKTFTTWRSVPAPKRGELVKAIGDQVRVNKTRLAEVITLEAGKTMRESLGEVQEWIDMCDFAVGLSRQLHGLTIASERPGHRMMEQWHPLGVVGVISAFNFPMAVWAWNAMLAFVCGDTVVWKPSEKTPMCALAAHSVTQAAMRALKLPDAWALSSVVIGGADVGEALAADARVPLVSATGSTRMGKAVAQTVARRLGRSLLELGGNNAMIVTPSADLDLAIRAIVFAAVGTTGQRCTTLRRLIVHRSIKDKVLQRLEKAYRSLRIGDPANDDNHLGPLIDEQAYDAMMNALSAAQRQGGTVIGDPAGVRITPGGTLGRGTYVRPVLVEITADAPVVQEEVFAPILYVMPYDTLDQAMAMHNNVPQGLSSAIFTTDIREAERFMSPAGSDCGIANVNIGTSGAEIGGAFGGEKDTGGGRESGSDAWKAYMRRSTNTVNYSHELPLAQGIVFEA
jgi:aldehyde dehydrogenase (NAD+)